MTGALLLALAPIALLIAIGTWLNRSRFVAGTFWAQAERLGYYVLLPALFLHGLATAKLDGVPVQGMILVLVVSTVSVAVLLVASRPMLKGNDAAFTSVFQGGVRFNNYVGVSIVAGLFGAQGIALGPWPTRLSCRQSIFCVYWCSRDTAQAQECRWAKLPGSWHLIRWCLPVSAG